MKRGTPDHWKMEALGNKLPLTKFERKYAKVIANGVMERLWHYTARFHPRGDIGKAPDWAIADACHWPDPRKNGTKLVDALVDSGWVDRSEEHRLIVHDWHEHADESVKKVLTRGNLSFLTPGDSLGTIYVLHCESTNLVKIGFTRMDVDRRIAALQTGSSGKLTLLASKRGQKSEETRIHRVYSELRTAGEWFRLEGSLLEFVDSIGISNETGKHDTDPSLPAFPILPLPEPLPRPKPEPSDSAPFGSNAARGMNFDAEFIDFRAACIEWAGSHIVDPEDFHEAWVYWKLLDGLAKGEAIAGIRAIAAAESPPDKSWRPKWYLKGKEWKRTHQPRLTARERALAKI